MSRRLALSAHAFLFSVSESVLWTIMLIYLTDAGFSPAQAFIISAVPSLMELILSPAWGVVGERWGRRGAIIMGGLAYAAFGPVMLVFKSFWSLLLMSILVWGLATARYPSFMAEMTSLSDRVSEDVGMVILSESAGWVLGSLLSSGLFAAGAGYTGCFALLSSTAVAASAVLVGYPAGKSGSVRASLNLRKPEFFASLFAVYLGASAFYPPFMLLMYRILGRRRDAYSLAIFLASLTSVVSSPLYGRLAERAGESRVLVAFSFARAVYFLLLPLMSNPIVVLVLFAVPLWNGIVIPAVSIVSSIYPEEKAVGQGIHSSIMAASDSLGRFISALLVSLAPSGLDGLVFASMSGGLIALIGSALLSVTVKRVGHSGSAQ